MADHGWSSLYSAALLGRRLAHLKQKEHVPMNTLFLLSYLALWFLTLSLAFLLLGTMWALGGTRESLKELASHVSQLEVTTLELMDGKGLRLGKRAPLLPLH